MSRVPWSRGTVPRPCGTLFPHGSPDRPPRVAPGGRRCRVSRADGRRIVLALRPTRTAFRASGACDPDRPSGRRADDPAALDRGPWRNPAEIASRGRSRTPSRRPHPLTVDQAFLLRGEAFKSESFEQVAVIEIHGSLRGRGTPFVVPMSESTRSGEPLGDPQGAGESTRRPSIHSAACRSLS